MTVCLIDGHSCSVGYLKSQKVIINLLANCISLQYLVCAVHGTPAIQTWQYSVVEGSVLSYQLEDNWRVAFGKNRAISSGNNWDIAIQRCSSWKEDSKSQIKYKLTQNFWVHTQNFCSKHMFRYNVQCTHRLVCWSKAGWWHHWTESRMSWQGNRWGALQLGCSGLTHSPHSWHCCIAGQLLSAQSE